MYRNSILVILGKGPQLAELRPFDGNTPAERMFYNEYFVRRYDIMNVYLATGKEKLQCRK